MNEIHIDILKYKIINYFSQNIMLNLRLVSKKFNKLLNYYNHNIIIYFIDNMRNMNYEYGNRQRMSFIRDNINNKFITRKNKWHCVNNVESINLTFIISINDLNLIDDENILIDYYSNETSNYIDETSNNIKKYCNKFLSLKMNNLEKFFKDLDLKKLTKLEKLTISNFDAYSINLSELSNLKILKCNYKSKNEEIENLNKLEELDIKNCHMITNLGIKKLTNLKKLVCNSNITDEGIKNLYKLEFIDISKCEKNISIKTLKNFKNLKRIKCCHRNIRLKNVVIEKYSSKIDFNLF